MTNNDGDIQTCYLGNIKHSILNPYTIKKTWRSQIQLLWMQTLKTDEKETVETVVGMEEYSFDFS